MHCVASRIGYPKYRLSQLVRIIDVLLYMVTNEFQSLPGLGRHQNLLAQRHYLPSTRNLQYNQNISKSCPYSLFVVNNLQRLSETRRIKIMLSSFFSLDWFCVQSQLPTPLPNMATVRTIPLSEFCPAYLKLTSVRQTNATMYPSLCCHAQSQQCLDLPS